MTLCVAIRHTSGILLGADSSACDGYGPTPEKTRKIFSADGRALAGCGSIQEIHKYGALWLDCGTQELLRKLRSSPAKDFQCLIAEGRTLRIVSEDGSVGHPKHKYIAIGSGDDLATGYLTAVRAVAVDWTQYQAERITRACFRAVARFDHQVRSPYRIVHILRKV